MVVANSIIAGVTKSGSTSVFRYLADHPDVCLSSQKETCFFLPAHDAEGPQLSAEAYSAFWRHHQGESCIFEATPGYFYGGAPLIGQIQRICGSPKVVVVLREPVARTVSYFKFMKSMLELDKEMTLAEYVAECERRDPVRLELSAPYAGVDRSCYAKFLPEWEEGFGSDLKVMFFEDLKTDPDAFMKDLCAHIGIAPPPRSVAEQPVHNQTRSYGNAQLHSVALKVNRAGEGLFMRMPALKTALVRIYYSLNKSRAPFVDPTEKEARAALKEYFAPWNRSLKEQLTATRPDLALPAWLETA